MQDIKICCADLEGRPADVRGHQGAILRRLRQAQRAGAGLLLLPSLTLPGSSCGDLFYQDTLFAACERAAGELGRLSRQTAIVFGLPLMLGGRRFIVSALAYQGQLRGLVPKQQLSAMERRWFSPWEGGPGLIHFAGAQLPIDPDMLFELPGGLRLGLVDSPTDQALRLARPLIRQGANLIAIQSSEPTLAGEGFRRREQLRQLSLQVACCYQNAGLSESTTDWVYGGESLLACGGDIIAERLAFARPLAATATLSLAPRTIQAPAFDARPRDVVVSPEPYAPPEGFLRRQWCREAIEIAAQGLARRMTRIQAKAAVLGLSGGLDSAMAMITTARALEIAGLPKEALLAYSLPCFGSSQRTRGNALKMMRAMDLKEREIDISASVIQHLQDIGHQGQIDAAYENAQARERTQVLMDIANMTGGLMVGTGDLSEAALGFTTYGGDHMSMYAVNIGLYKSAIRFILRDVADNAHGELGAVLRDILDTPISPELQPGGQQHTEKLIGPYALNDFYLYYVLKENLRPQSLLRYAKAAFGTTWDRQTLLYWMRQFYKRFFAAQFRRSCLPDGPQLLSVSLSPRGGLSLPSDACAALWLQQIDALIGEEE